MASPAKTNTDAFERLRVSNPTSVFDVKFQYDLQPLLFESALTGSGTATHNADSGSCEMAVTTADGDKVIRQSRQYCTYQPGKSQGVFVTGSMGIVQEGTRSRMGYYDDKNGVFLQQDSDGVSIVFRSNVTGTVVDTVVPEADWNVDSVALDLTKSQIFVVDLQWLGVGRVRTGFDIGGKLRWAHQFYNDGRNPAAYWTSATLPIRYEIENTAEVASAATMHQVCCSVQSEGGLDLNKGLAFSEVNTSAIAVSAAGLTPLLSIRPKTTFNSITNHVGIIPSGFEGFAEDGVTIQVIYGGTLTGASWSDVDTTNSAVEWDQSATAVSGGTVIYTGFVPDTSVQSGALNVSEFPNLLWLTNNIAGDTTTPLTIVATSFTGTVETRAALRWVEVR